MRRAIPLLLASAALISACGRAEKSDSHANMALLLLREGQVDAAMEQLQRATQRADGERMPNWLPEVIDHLLSRRELDLADSLLALRSTDGEPPAELIFPAASLAELRGELRRADELYVRIDPTHPRHQDALAKRATLALMEGRAADAVAHARAVLQRDRFAHRTRTVLAQALLAEGKAAEAYAEIVQTPVGPTRFLVEGEALLRSGRAAEAIAPLREILRVQGQFPQPHYLLGQAYLESGDFVRAHAELAPLAAAQPPYEESQMHLATLAQRQGHTARADSLLAVYQTHRQWRDAMALRNEGLEKSRAGALAEALDFFQRAQDALPDNAELANDRGAILARLTRYDEAEQAFLYAVRVQPSNAAAHRNLANLYQLTGDEQARDVHMQTYLRLVVEQQREKSSGE